MSKVRGYETEQCHRFNELLGTRQSIVCSHNNAYYVGRKTASAEKHAFLEEEEEGWEKICAVVEATAEIPEAELEYELEVGARKTTGCRSRCNDRKASLIGWHRVSPEAPILRCHCGAPACSVLTAYSCSMLWRTRSCIATQQRIRVIQYINFLHFSRMRLWTRCRTSSSTTGTNAHLWGAHIPVSRQQLCTRATEPSERAINFPLLLNT